MAETVPDRVHIRFRKRIFLEKGKNITLGRISHFLAPPSLEDSLSHLVLVQPGPKDGNMILVDILQVVEAIGKLYPEVDVEHFGEPHALVEIVAKHRSPRWLAVAAVWLLLFVGSGLAIMNFHADVSMLAVHRRIYYLITGETVIGNRMLILQIPYSLGIGVGMVLFFNHILKKKFNEEPSPLEVEMYLYLENMHRYIVTEEYAKKNKGSK